MPGPLKRILVILLISWALVGAAVFIIHERFERHKESMDVSSKAFVDTIVPEILKTWDPNLIVSTASSEMLLATPVTQIETSCSWLSARLGSLNEYHGAVGKSSVLLSFRDGVNTWANYVATASFVKGVKASIEVKIRKEGKDWKMVDFVVHSPVLEESAANK